MLRSVSIENFTAVPYLNDSALMLNHGGKLNFSLDRPTVLVGPNGSGKSALLTTLAIRFLAYFTGESTLEEHYVEGAMQSKTWWTEKNRWRGEHLFLTGLTCDTDNAPAVYYRPGHVPGNEASSTHALMMGYWDEARAYQAATEKKSSGQANHARLDTALAIISGISIPTLQDKRWTYGRDRSDLSTRSGWVSDRAYRAEVLKELFRAPGTHPLVLLDEPEQSLDALHEGILWKAIESGKGTQVIVATHSLYPFQHPDRFQIIETVPGYVRSVQDFIG